jgi:hypothetical protein
MKKLIAALILSLSACGGIPASAYELETEDYFTNGSMGCMMMRECTKNVKEVKSIKDIEDYQRKDHSLIANEFNDVLKAVNDVGINVYIAPMEYFLIGTRGVYYTDGNNIFLNADMVERSTSLISTFRHEGWHAVQDCMAGDIKNSFIAIVYPQDKVPKYLQALAENTYTATTATDKVSSVIWEKEAYWMGHTEGATIKALKACKAGNMWEMYPPTPMTREFLVEKGYIKE